MKTPRWIVMVVCLAAVSRAFGAEDTAKDAKAPPKAAQPESSAQEKAPAVPPKDAAATPANRESEDYGAEEKLLHNKHEKLPATKPEKPKPGSISRTVPKQPVFRPKPASREQSINHFATSPSAMKLAQPKAGSKPLAVSAPKTTAPEHETLNREPVRSTDTVPLGGPGASVNRSRSSSGLVTLGGPTSPGSKLGGPGARNRNY
jgi:hypothetical protein